ncbi:MAG: hypothetical protein EOM54_03195 [Clostridia bacterium]|nr:hypothetical protein [Clostridia bacterium]
MKRKVAAILVALCIFFSLAPSRNAEAASDICFIAINDSLMELSSTAYFRGPTLYVPYSVFVYFQIYYSYYSNSSTATLYTASKQIYFELESGNTYDSEGEYYSSSAISLNGQTYVSVAFVCAQFGLSWSYIPGTGSGDICRIKNGAVILSDSQFLAAASSLMAERYEAYFGGATGSTPTDPSNPGTGNENGCDLYLSFQGMPSAFLLDTLKSYGITSCFFVTADEVRENPGIIRRIVGEGHGIGVLCSDDPEAEYEETVGLIFEAARINTVLIAASLPEFDEVCEIAAEGNGLVFWNYEIDGVQGGAGISSAALVTAFLSFYTDRADLRIQCSDATDKSIASVCYYIYSDNYILRSVCEIGSEV